MKMRMSSFCVSIVCTKKRHDFILCQSESGRVFALGESCRTVLDGHHHKFVVLAQSDIQRERREARS